MGKHPRLSETKATKGENEAILLQFNNPEELYANNPVKQEPLTHFQRGESCIPGSYRRSSVSVSEYGGQLASSLAVMRGCRYKQAALLRINAPRTEIRR